MRLFKKKKRIRTMSDDELIKAKRTGIKDGSEPVEIFDDEDQPKRANKRYKKAANVVGFVKFVVLAVFFAFFVFMIFAYSKQISVENFRYIIKDLNIKIPTGIEEFGQIYYVADMDQSYGLYRDDFVCVGRNKVEVVDMNGRTIQSSDLRYVNPRIVTSDKYMLVYDLSNTQYGVYNSFSPLHSETLDYPISAADMNDNGYYMIVTRDAECKTVVNVYTDEMKLCYSYRTNSVYTYDCVLHNDGTFELYTSKAQDGTYFSGILSSNIKSEEDPARIYERKNALVLKAAQSGEKTVSVLFSDSVVFLKDGVEAAVYPFGDRVCRKFTAADGYTALLLSTAGAGADSELFVFDTEGDLVYQSDSKSDVSRLYIHNGNVYSLCTSEIKRTELKTSKTYTYTSGYESKGIVFADNEVLLVATSSRAYPISVYDDFKNDAE